MAKSITITKKDFDRLKALIPAEMDPADPDKQVLRDLRGELERAHVVEPNEIDPDIVTMNSQVRIRDVDSGDENEYTIVYPQASDFSKGKISILVPLGTALLGYRKGDIIEWNMPGGIRKIKVVKVLYQPEANGNFSA
ncbi:MAG: nucleoside diphosphate kinase regulator [Candidatus Aminicenantes bacterium]|nr:nucleoside diphosphate kinase regulator [Candidatus Aminicenantes bacterium]